MSTDALPESGWPIVKANPDGSLEMAWLVLPTVQCPLCGRTCIGDLLGHLDGEEGVRWPDGTSWYNGVCFCGEQCRSLTALYVHIEAAGKTHIAAHVVREALRDL